MTELTPIYRHIAKDPWRFLYDTHVQNDTGWSEGTVAFYAHPNQQAGTIPIYRHTAKDPWRFLYDTHLQNNTGWSEGTVAFYAYATQQPGTIPIYRHTAKDPWRFLYDTQVQNNTGWSQGIVAFYAFPPGWMSSIDDRALLSQMSLPGTHETMSRYGANSECQKWTLSEQLTNGLRVFDIRLRYLKGANGEVNFSVHHSTDYQYAFFDSKFPYTSDCKYWVLDECLEFLKHNNRECIVLLIKQERDVQDRATFFDAFWKIIDNRAGYNNQPLDKLFYVPNTVPRLGDARGRIIFVFVDGDDGPSKQLSNPRWGLYWGNIDYEVNPNHVLPGQQPNLDIENHWQDLKEWKWDKVSAHLKKALATRASSNIWFSTFVSASRAPLVNHFPVDYANYLLPKVQSVLTANLAAPPAPWGSYFGTVMMDFPTKEIIGLLIAASFRYQYV
ncbi:MAG TPA: hypothetical protein VGW57_02280 [Chthoniobacterales bacterium]|nr:hypothetical protein [Chthoniobacterales bacterium]